MKTLRSTPKLKPFSKSIQFRLNMFILFLAFPAFSVLGNSITFYIFIDLIFRLGIRKVNFKGRYLFFAFFTVGLISSIFTPVADRHPGILPAIIILIQFLYWISIASFFIKNYSRINLMQLSKWMLIGTLMYVFVFFIIPFNFKSGLVSIEFEPGRNALVFNFLCSIPLSFYYIYKRWDKRGVLIGLFFFLFVMLATNGRAGAIVFLIESLLILCVVYVKAQKYFRFVLIVIIALFIFSHSDSNQERIQVFSYQVGKINPRLGELLRSGEDGSFKRDKSWLQRKLLIEKGMEIFIKHPFIGIGPNLYRYYDSDLDAYSSFDYLQNNPKEFYNQRSAHNSYIQVLAEFGIIGFTLFAIILLAPMLLFIRLLFKAKLKIEHFPLISLIGISIHFYTVSAFTGAISWIIFGFSWAIINQNKDKNYFK